MSIIWSVVWGILALAIMSITIKYYLPMLSKRTQVMASEAPANSKDNSDVVELAAEKCGKYRSEILNNRAFTVTMLVLCAGFAVWCGYTASEHSASIIGMLKMTLGMCVLCCTFITDMELMMIPNLCPSVLLAGRTITIITEFIWMKDEALAWLLNSLIALVISLLLLLLMSKLTRGGLGMGDVKLFSSLGFLCGVRAVCFTLMFAFLICALASTGLLLSRKKRLKDSLPLGPFIWLGYGVTVLLSIM